MKAKRLSAQNAVRLLSEFYRQNPEEAEIAFGWQHEPDVLRPNERVYAYRDLVSGESFADSGQATIGFGILEMNLKDARDDEAFLSCGVFPQYRRRGYWHKIMADLIVKAKDLGADYCSRTVNKENEEHYKRSIREAYEGSGWVHVGDHWGPYGPGHGYFVWLFDDGEREEVRLRAKAKTGGQA